MRPPSAARVPEIIETERLVLRSPMPGDGPAVNEAIVESWNTLSQWMPWARERPAAEQTEDLVRQFRANFVARIDLPMLMFLRDRRTFVGGTGLHRMDWSVPRFEIGYWVRQSLQRQGYASEAVRALTRVALDELGGQRVEIHCSHRNIASQRVAERCGFTLEGRLRNHAREPAGELRDTLIYSIVPALRARG